MKVGKDTVVIGNVPSNTEVGDGSVVIGATDSNGNTILNTPMAIGRNASAGPGSIAIGAGANAGSAHSLAAELHELTLMAERADDKQTVAQLEALKAELTRTKPNHSVIAKIWNVVKITASINGAHTLLAKIATVLGL